MKVVLGVHHFPPDNVGGVELLTLRLARWLRDRGHVVEVVSVSDVDGDETLTVRTDCQDGIVVHRLGLKLTGSRWPLGLAFRSEIVGQWFREYLQRSKPDLFHAESCYLLTASTIEAAKGASIPVVVTLHDYWFLCPRLTLLRPNGERCASGGKPAECAWCLLTERRRYRYLDTGLKTLHGKLPAGRIGTSNRLLDGTLLEQLRERESYLLDALRSADRIIVPAPLARDLLVERGFPAESIQLVRWGLDLTRWMGETRNTPSDEGLCIGYLGQLAPHKGVHLLIRAFTLISSPARPRELKIYGDTTRLPVYSARLKRLAMGDRRIRFPGPYDNSEVERVLQGVDVLVIPSIWFEVSPIVIMEGFAAGLPIVASNLPNMQYQIRDGVDGLLFAPDDAWDLAKKLQLLCEQPELLRRLQEGIAPVRPAEDELAETEEIYRSVAGKVTG